MAVHGKCTHRFFEARNNPSTAPLAAWFNGGPGCSSMIGLFQENGPCHFVNGESTPSLNEYSFNTYANMLYVDQPIGTGFSYGTDKVDSTVSAAPYVWTLLQAFYAQFPEYESRDFGIWTEVGHRSERLVVSRLTTNSSYFSPTAATTVPNSRTTSSSRTLQLTPDQLRARRSTWLRWGSITGGSTRPSRRRRTLTTATTTPTGRSSRTHPPTSRHTTTTAFRQFKRAPARAKMLTARMRKMSAPATSRIHLSTRQTTTCMIFVNRPTILILRARTSLTCRMHPSRKPSALKSITKNVPMLHT